MKQINTKSKEELELEKLSLEVKEYRKCWFRKYSFWKAFLPSLIIASATCFVGYKSGLIEKLNDEIKIRQEKITIYVDSINNYKNNLTLKEKESIKQFKKQEELNIDKLNADEKALYYKNKFDSIMFLLIKKNTIEQVINNKSKLTEESFQKLTEDGKIMVTEDGKIMVTE